MASRRASRLVRIFLRPPTCRAFSGSARCMVNPLLNLSHFSASKEAQYFSKEKKIPREEFVPYLELIRSSEVDPFAPAPGASPVVVGALRRARMGKADMQTTYNLAISNLIEQVAASRRDAMEARTAFETLYEKHKKEERSALLLMLATVGILSFVAAKTDAIDHIRDYVRRSGAHWEGFDWEWLGNPPSHKGPPRLHTTSSSQPGSAAATVITPAGTAVPLQLIETQPESGLTNEQEKRSPAEIIQPSTSWSLSRLFWAASR